MGRSTLYTKELDAKAKEYVEGGYEEENHPFPSVVGMAVVLKIAKSTIYQWAEDGRGDIADTLGQCNDCQELKVMHGSIKNELNATIAKLVLANFGYHDKADNTLSGPNGKPVQTDSIFEFIPVGSDANSKKD